MERETKINEPIEPDLSSESLIASTESESYDTWTLVSEKSKRQSNETIIEAQNINKDHIGLIEKDDNIKRDNDSIDDLSDGISIISDSESGGRNSPHPSHSIKQATNLNDNKNNLENINSTQNLSLSSNESDEQENNEIQYVPLTTTSSPKSTQTCDEKMELIRLQKSQALIEERTRNYDDGNENSRPVINLGIRGAFLLSIIVALIAICGRMKYPEWDHLSLKTQIAPLAERIEDLELQNNLLRAEIDLLNKQMNYLKQLKNKQTQKHEPPIKNSFKKTKDQHEFKESDKSTKIWSADDDINIENDPIEVEYKSQPLNQEYGKFESNMNSKRHHEEQHAKGQRYKEKGFIDRHHEKSDRGYEKNEYVDQKPIKIDVNKKSDEIPYHKSTEKNFPSSSINGKFEYQNQKYVNGKPFERENRNKKHEKHFNSNENYENNNHEKYRKQDKKKQQWENYDSHEIKKDKNGKHDDWHERMMKHRENSRKKHSDDNWYIERGNSREEARIFSTET